MPYFTPKYVIFSTLFKARTTVLKETNDKRYLCLMALTQTNKLKLLLAISLLFVCFFSLKCHVCLTLVIKKTKVRKKNCKLVTVTSLVRCAILDSGSRECSTSPYFRPIRVKSIRTVRPKGIKNLGTAYSHIVNICWSGPSCSKGG